MTDPPYWMQQQAQPGNSEDGNHGQQLPRSSAAVVGGTNFYAQQQPPQQQDLLQQWAVHQSQTNAAAAAASSSAGQTLFQQAFQQQQQQQQQQVAAMDQLQQMQQRSQDLMTVIRGGGANTNNNNAIMLGGLGVGGLGSSPSSSWGMMGGGAGADVLSVAAMQQQQQQQQYLFQQQYNNTFDPQGLMNRQAQAAAGTKRPNMAVAGQQQQQHKKYHKSSAAAAAAQGMDMARLMGGGGGRNSTMKTSAAHLKTMRTKNIERLRSEKKRNQEKVRRSNLNEKYTALIQIVKRIEAEEDQMERTRRRQQDVAKLTKRNEEEAQKRQQEKEEQEQEQNQKDVEGTTSGTIEDGGDVDGSENKQQLKEKEGQEQDASVTIDIREELGLQNLTKENEDEKQKMTKKEEEKKMMTTANMNSKTSTTGGSKKKDIAMLSAEASATIIMAARKEFKKKFPCFISPSNRADLIARTVSHLGRFGDIHLQQRDTIRALQKKLDAINAAKEESLASIQHIEEMNAMNGTTMNMNSDGVGISGSTNPESSMSDVSTSQQQQQQMPMMTFMAPMMMNLDGTVVNTATTEAGNGTSTAPANAVASQGGLVGQSCYNPQQFMMTLPIDAMHNPQFQNLMMMSNMNMPTASATPMMAPIPSLTVATAVAPAVATAAAPILVGPSGAEGVTTPVTTDGMVATGVAEKETVPISNAASNEETKQLQGPEEVAAVETTAPAVVAAAQISAALKSTSTGKVSTVTDDVAGTGTGKESAPISSSSMETETAANEETQPLLEPSEEATVPAAKSSLLPVSEAVVQPLEPSTTGTATMEEDEMKESKKEGAEDGKTEVSVEMRTTIEEEDANEEIKISCSPGAEAEAGSVSCKEVESSIEPQSSDQKVFPEENTAIGATLTSDPAAVTITSKIEKSSTNTDDRAVLMDNEEKESRTEEESKTKESSISTNEGATIPGNEEKESKIEESSTSTDDRAAVPNNKTNEFRTTEEGDETVTKLTTTAATVEVQAAEASPLLSSSKTAAAEEGRTTEAGDGEEN